MPNYEAFVRPRRIVSVSDSDAEIANVLRESMRKLGVETAQIVMSPSAYCRGTAFGAELEKKLAQFRSTMLEPEAHPEDFEVGTLVAKFEELEAELVETLSETSLVLMHAIDTPIAEDAGSAFDDASSSAMPRANFACPLDVLDADEMLTSAQFGKLMNISRQAVIDKVKRNSVLALQGNKRGFKFPAWQLDAKYLVLKGIKEVLERLDGDHWATYRYLTNSYPDGTGRKGYQVLQQEGADPLFKWISSGERGGFD